VGSLRFGDLRVETNAGHHVFEVEVFLNDLDRVRRELSFLRTESTAAIPHGWKWSVRDRNLTPPAGASITRRYPPHVQRRLHGASDSPVFRSGGSLESARILWQR